MQSDLSVLVDDTGIRGQYKMKQLAVQSCLPSCCCVVSVLFIFVSILDLLSMVLVIQ